MGWKAAKGLQGNKSSWEKKTTPTIFVIWPEATVLEGILGAHGEQLHLVTEIDPQALMAVST